MDKKTSDAQLRAVSNYRKKNIKRITTDFYPTEQDLWDHVQTKDNKQGYIKDLIRADMEKGRA